MKSSTPITRGGWEATGTSADRRSHPGRPPGKRAAKARQNLLDAARAAFDQHGYADTTVEHIVNRAGVARGSFYTYFESKTDIFRHLCSAIDRQVATDVVGFERSPDSDPITIAPLIGTTTAVVIKPTSGSVAAHHPSYTFHVLCTEWTPLNGAVGDLSTVSITWPISGAITKATS